ncbi:MAG: efflux RND transporter periplasmic adaptor subunit [Chthoniobacterales bacterium]
MDTQHKKPSSEIPAAAPEKASEHPAVRINKRLPNWIWVCLGVFALFVLFVAIQRMFHNSEVRATTRELAIPSVLVTTPTIGSPDIHLVLPGNVEPYAETPIFARTDGYVKRWLVDIGTPVKEGQLLAEIDSPEVDRQYDQAQAAVEQAEANFKLAQDTAQRWKYLLQKSSVSQQETEQKLKEMEASQASLAQVKANLARLDKLKSFQQITAPFEGTVTMRTVNVGDLINSGSATAKSEMFHIAQDKILRVYVSVPETYASQVKVGQEANIKLASLPDQIIKGHIANTAGAINAQSRTLLVEVQIDNSAHEFLAGGYATVDFPIHLAKPGLILPVNALLFRPGGTVVGVVKDNTVKLQKIEIGKDFGNAVEVMNGLDANDNVIVNPSDSLRDGDKVRPETVSLQKAKG